jgi:release factor glutamine methyltransferase
MEAARFSAVNFAGHTVGDALESAVTAIGAAGCETPRLDAEVLLAHVLDVPRERLFLDRDLRVRGKAVPAFQQAVRRRAVEREPVAYIVGHRGFRHLDLAVDARALVPRPETELLVELADVLPPRSSVLDLGTGSGAIALALKQERPDLLISASDVSQAALELARENSRLQGLSVSFLQADLLEGVPDEFDAILSNPPYVADSERARLAPEILRHEPAEALFAGPDGLDVIRRLFVQLAARERVRLVAVEVGHDQAGAVAALARDARFTRIRVERDLAGIERVVVAERPFEGGHPGRERRSGGTRERLTRARVRVRARVRHFGGPARGTAERDA